MKTSHKLLVAWIVVVIGLAGAVLFFATKGGPPAPAPVPDQPLPKRQQPTVKPPHPLTSNRGSRTTPSTTSQAPLLQIGGFVHDAAGKPVPGAHVALFVPTKPSRPLDAPNMEEIQKVNSVIYVATEEWDRPRRLDTWTAPEGDEARADAEVASAETNAEGTFTITLQLHQGTGPFRLTAAKEGVGTGGFASARAGEKVDVLLGNASSLRGIVLTQINSQPVPGARVVLDTGGRRVAVVTDEAGRFEAAGITPGTYQLTVAAKGYTPLFETKRVVVNDPTPITLRLPRGTLLRVKAVVPVDGSVKKGSLPEGQPVPNADIVALHQDTLAYVVGRTNAEGIVEFQGMPAGNYNINGMAKGFVSDGEMPAKIDSEKQVEEVAVEFSVAVETPVEVVDEDGRPVAGMDFYAQSADEKYDALRSVKVAATDGDGKLKYPFEFDGPRSALYGFKSGYAVVHAQPDDNESGEVLKLVAKKAVRVHGAIRTSDGTPVANAVIDIDVSPADPEAQEISLQVRSDAQGNYDFPYLPHADGISLAASAPDGSAEGEEELELAPGQNEYTKDVVLDTEQSVTPNTAPTKTVPPTRHAPPGKEDK